MRQCLLALVAFALGAITGVVLTPRTATIRLVRAGGEPPEQTVLDAFGAKLQQNLQQSDANVTASRELATTLTAPDAGADVHAVCSAQIAELQRNLAEAARRIETLLSLASESPLEYYLSREELEGLTPQEVGLGLKVAQALGDAITGSQLKEFMRAACSHQERWRALSEQWSSIAAAAPDPEDPYNAPGASDVQRALASERSEWRETLLNIFLGNENAIEKLGYTNW